MKIERTLSFSSILQLYNSFPTVMRLLPGPHQTVLKNWDTVKDFLRAEIEQHKKDRDLSEPRDYIDCYLSEIEKVRSVCVCELDSVA